MLEKKERVRPNKHQPELGPLYIAQCWKKEKKNSKLNLAFTPMRQSRSPVPHLIFYLRFSLPHVKTPHRIPPSRPSSHNLGLSDLFFFFVFFNLCFDLRWINSPVSLHRPGSISLSHLCDFALSCGEEVMGLNQCSIEVILIMHCFLLILYSPLLEFELFDLNVTNFC